MTNVRSRKCVCGAAQALYGRVGDKRATCCSKCKTPDMVNLHKRKCACGSAQPSYGRVGDMRASCCSKCKTPDMADLYNPKCVCGAAIASFGHVGDKRATCCYKCKTSDMVNVRSLKCVCGAAQALYGRVGDKRATCCALCKTGDMVGLYRPKCVCGAAIPSFGRVGDKRATCCSKCKTPVMVDLINPKCVCGAARPSYGRVGDKKPSCCSKCKTPDMVDLHNKNKMCKHCGDTRANPRYRGHCLFCFMHKFPDEPVARNYKTKERAVQEFLTASFGSTRTLVFDRVVEPVVPAGADEFEVVPCSRRRPDVLIDMGTYVVVVEIDENQHDTYETMCENKRVMEIFRDSGRRPLVMIRFNPDGYTDESGRKHPSPWGVQKHTGVLSVMPKRRAAWDARLEALRVAVASALAAPPVKDVTFVFLYF